MNQIRKREMTCMKPTVEVRTSKTDDEVPHSSQRLLGASFSKLSIEDQLIKIGLDYYYYFF